MTIEGFDNQVYPHLGPAHLTAYSMNVRFSLVSLSV